MATLEEMQARYRETLDELGAARKARRWGLVKAINVERYALRGSIARVMEIEKDFATVQVDSLAVHLADAENEVRHLKQENLDLLAALEGLIAEIGVEWPDSWNAAAYDAAIVAIAKAQGVE